MLNPMEDVRKSCKFVTETTTFTEYVTIVDAPAISDAVIYLSTKIQDVSGGKCVQFVDWDASGMHYCADADNNGHLTAQYIFVLDALNFCFWPNSSFEYDSLATSLKKVLEKDSTSFKAEILAAITPETLESWFAPHIIPNVEERVLRVRELGAVLLKDFDGLAINVAKKANRSAVELVRLILMHFPGFRDTAIFNGRLIHFYKRAQILVGDLWAAYGRKKIISLNEQHINDNNYFIFDDLDQLTMFADYRIPQILRNMGVLIYSSELSYKVDNKIEIPSGSLEEISIRAATVVAVEKLKEAIFSALGISLLSIELDWLLWQLGEDAKDSMLPNHRTLTIYY
eukprot:gene14213-19070_t